MPVAAQPRGRLPAAEQQGVRSPRRAAAGEQRSRAGLGAARCTASVPCLWAPCRPTSSAPTPQHTRGFSPNPFPRPRPGLEHHPRERHAVAARLVCRRAAPAVPRAAGGAPRGRHGETGQAARGDSCAWRQLAPRLGQRRGVRGVGEPAAGGRALHTRVAPVPCHRCGRACCRTARTGGSSQEPTRRWTRCALPRIRTRNLPACVPLAPRGQRANASLDSMNAGARGRV